MFPSCGPQFAKVAHISSEWPILSFPATATNEYLGTKINSAFYLTKTIIKNIFIYFFAIMKKNLGGYYGKKY